MDLGGGCGGRVMVAVAVVEVIVVLAAAASLSAAAVVVAVVVLAVDSMVAAVVGWRGESWRCVVRVGREELRSWCVRGAMWWCGRKGGWLVGGVAASRGARERRRGGAGRRE